MPTPATYYTNCSPIITGCFLYLNSNYTGPVPAGYYSNGVQVYQVTGSLGQVTDVTICPSTTLPPCTNCCFVANTMISLANGDIKSIKNIQVGDVVLSFNEQLNNIEPNKVLSIKSRTTNDLVRYTFTNGVMIESTIDHPYYVNGFKIASFDPISTTEKYNFEIDIDLIKIGDVVNLADGTTSVIEDIETLDLLEQVYTFEVENNHNYYANGILVHNKTPGTICCYNTVTQQYQTVSNAGGNHSGCCCLGPNWVNTNLSNCSL